MSKKKSSSESHNITFFQGVLLGGVIGALTTLWYTPINNRRIVATLREQVEATKTVLQGESVEQSLQHGKALAHHHRASLAQSMDDEH